MRQDLLRLHEQRLDVLKDAEAGARQLASKVKELLSLNKEVAALAHQLSGERRTPGALAQSDLINRIAGRIGSLMQIINPAYRSGFGGIAWPATSSFHPVTEDWAANEERRLTPALEPILKRED